MGLAYPCGVAPGFDQSHVAAVGISQGHGFSGIASNGGFRSLLSGAPGTISGAPTGLINGITGPATKFSGATDRIVFSGQSAANDTNATLAGVVVSDAVSAANPILFSTGANGFGWDIYLQNNLFQMLAGNVNSISSGITLSTGVPYFIACSHTQTGSVVNNFVVLNLNTGSLKTATNGTVASPGAPNGTYQVGNDVTLTVSKCSLSAVMFAPSFMSMAGLTQWAADPWSFWYPG